MCIRDRGYIIIGIHDETFEIIGIHDLHNYNTENIKFTLIKNCTNLSSENLEIKEHTTSDTNKIVWIVKVPKHPFRQPVYAHKKAWQRIGAVSYTHLDVYKRQKL